MTIPTLVVATVAGALAGALASVFLSYFLGLRSNRLVRLQEKYAEVLAELSGLLFEVEDKYQKWYAPSLRTPQAMLTTSERKGKVAERRAATIDSLNALTRCYHRNIAWLEPDVAARIDSAITELQKMLYEYGRFGPDNTHFTVSEKGVQVAKAMEDRIPKIRKELVDEFRGIVRPPSLWSRLWRRIKTTCGVRSSTPPPNSPPDGPQSPARPAPKASPTPTPQSPQTDVQRPWWRRILGG